jgi:GT2 family glycosyltransferase
VVDNPGQLSSAGRNAGVHASRGEVILFVDGHCFIPGRHLLYDTARLMQERSVDALARPQPLRTPWNNDFQDLVASVRESALGHGRDSTIYSMTYSGLVDPTSSGATYRRSLFSEIGYYDDQFDACEDVEFNHRVKAAGKKCFIDPALAVFYVPRSKLIGLFKQMRRYGYGRRALHGKHRAAFSVSQFLPAAIVLYFATLPLCILLPRTMAAAYLAPAAAYVLALLWVAAGTATRFGRQAALTPLILVATHFGLGMGWWASVVGFGRKSRAARETSQAAAGGRA